MYIFFRTVTNITSEEEKPLQNEENVFGSQLGTLSSVFSNEMEEINQSHIPFVYGNACVEDSCSAGVSDLSGSSTQDHVVVVVVVGYPTPSEGWGHGGKPWSPRSWATLQGLDQRS